MFSHAAAFSGLALAALATATPTPEYMKRWDTMTIPMATRADTCDTGPIQCCNTVVSARSPAAAGILSLLGIVIGDLDVLVGLTCSPITVIGVGGGSCSANTVCCQDNLNEGLISIGCVNVTL